MIRVGLRSPGSDDNETTIAVTVPELSLLSLGAGKSGSRSLPESPPALPSGPLHRPHPPPGTPFWPFAAAYARGQRVLRLNWVVGLALPSSIFICGLFVHSLSLPQARASGLQFLAPSTIIC